MKARRAAGTARAGLWVAVVLSFATCPAYGERVILEPVQDTTLFESLEGSLSNGSGPGLFAGDNSERNTRRALLSFAIAAAIPAGAHIDAVELRLFLSNSPDTTVATTFAFFRVLSSWGEGASVSAGGMGAPSQPGDATWVHRFYPDTRWQNPGGDFDGTASVAFGVRLPGSYALSNSRLVDDVQTWLELPARDHGWLLQGEEAVAGSARRFDSKEHPDPSRRPMLVVDFTPLAVAPVTWGQVKSSFKD